MKYRYLLSLILLTATLMAGCQSINDPQLAEEMAVKLIESTGDSDLPEEPVVAMAETEVKVEAVEEPFEHLLSNLTTPLLQPSYIQWAPGESLKDQRELRVLFDEAVEAPELILVNEALEEMRIVAGNEVSAEVPIAYHFSLTNLQPGESYLYAIRTGHAYTEIHEMTLSEKDGLTFLIYGDLQGYKASQYQRFSQQMQTTLETVEADGIIHLGDIVDTGDNSDQWAFYMEAMTPVSDRLPVMSTIGNHDVKGGRQWYMNIFADQGNGLEEANLSTGYVLLEDAIIAYIDTERPSLFEAQMQWLTVLMSQSDKNHKIVLMHRSVYPIFYVEPHMQVWAEVFTEAGIDLVLSGHDHIYSRTVMDGVNYVVGGSGSGSKFYDRSEARAWEQVVFDDNQPVYMQLEVTEEALILQSYAVSEEGDRLIDTLTLSKGNY